MALVARRVLDDIAQVVASWEPPRERQPEPRAPRRPIFEVIDGGQVAPAKTVKFG
ncbi:hypothetical protein [Rhizobium ruizarguesonis]|uniref:hypothetical protein n=1 Tax=Rhizobium ruizarguesonis TaxID=2081791 RepID=UPI0013EED304|nr:hypothetical protein [Rhizobium ruizarguesonis]